MSGEPSKLATALIIIFVISIMVFLAQLFYILWRRRAFRRQAGPAGDGSRGDDVSLYSSTESNSTTAPYYSKELLYFFCFSPHFDFQRSSATSNSTASDLNSDRQSDVEAIDIDLLKVHGLFGPPRFLFTIEEEEKAETKSPAAKSHRSVETKATREVADQNTAEVCSENSGAETVPAPAETENCGVDDATPFSTPCGSPLYYFTPTASPVHEVINDPAGSGEVSVVPTQSR